MDCGTHSIRTALLEGNDAAFNAALSSHKWGVERVRGYSSERLLVRFSCKECRCNITAVVSSRC